MGCLVLFVLYLFSVILSRDTMTTVEFLEYDPTTGNVNLHKLNDLNSEHEWYP